MKQLVIVFLFILINQATSNMEIEIVSSNSFNDDLTSVNDSDQDEIAKMVNLSKSLFDNKKMVKGSLSDILSFGQNKIKKNKRDMELEQIERNIIGPIVGEIFESGKPAIQIEIISAKPKNLNMNHKPLPGRAFTKFDNAVQKFFDTFTESILGPNSRRINHINHKKLSHSDNSSKKIEKEIDNLIEELTDSVISRPKVSPIKLIELKHKRVPLIFHNNHENLQIDNNHEAHKVPDEVSKPLINSENQDENKLDSKSKNDMISKIEKSTWFKDMSTNKLIALLLKYITYLVFGIILFFIFYSCLMISLPSKSISKLNSNYNHKDEDDELESINKRQSETIR